MTAKARERTTLARCWPAFIALLPACTGGVESGNAYPKGNEEQSAASGASTGGAGGSEVAATSAGGGATSNASSSGGSGSDTDGGPTNSGGEVVLGEFTRLTRAEYRATVVQALGVAPDVHLLPEDGRVEHFTSNHRVTPDPVHPYLLASEELAALVVPERLPACDPGEPVECIEDLYAAALSELFRRDLVEADTTTLGAVLEAVAEGGGSADDATRAMLAAALLSPDFIYRASASAVDREPADVKNVARRVAERLSFALWDAPPDDELKQSLAESDELADVLLSETARMTTDARAVPVLARFFGQWLDVDTDLRLEDEDFASSPEYLELLAFVESAEADGMPVREFVGGKQGFAHRDNLELYDLGEGEGSGDVVSVTFAVESSRRGLLGQELFAGSTRHPDHSRREIFRGLLVRRALLCDEIPPPDPELVALAGEVEDRTKDGRCRNCHLRLDPIGRAFGDLDPDHEGTVTEAEVIGHDEVEGSYANAGLLLEAVAGSRAFAECFSRQWLAFFFEQPLSSIDTAWIGALADRVYDGASLGEVVEHTVGELHARSQTFVPWCQGS